MESLQLFTLLLLAVCAMHLLFSAVATLGQWLGKGAGTQDLTARGGMFSRSGWYVFFDPDDLYGKPAQSVVKNGPRKHDDSRTSSSSQKNKPKSRRLRPLA